jgi:hypothetical protein
MRKSVRARWWKCGGIVLPLVIGLTGCGTSPSTSTTATPTPTSTGAVADPGGRILAALRTATSAVPTRAHLNWSHFDEPKLDSCDGQPGTWGYDPVSVQVDFSLAESQSTVLTSVRHALQRIGWRLTEPTPATFSGQNYGTGDAIGTWVTTLPGGRPATAALFSDTHADATWSLIAEAPATLPPPKGC